MKFSTPLEEGVFLKRYKRFFADIDIGPSVVVAHVANSGSMKGCNDPQIPCRYQVHNGQNRKLPYSLEMVKTDSSWVGVNTMRPNQLVWEAWSDRIFPHWSKYDRAQKEVRINESSRLDFVLWESSRWQSERLQKHDFSKVPPRLHLVEVKNVSLAQGTQARFPDAVTERGQKHLRDLMTAIDQGHTAELIFVVQREDCSAFAPADDLDPEYGNLLRKAHAHGVQISPYACKLSKTEIRLNPKLLDLNL